MLGWEGLKLRGSRCTSDSPLTSRLPRGSGLCFLTQKVGVIIIIIILQHPSLGGLEEASLEVHLAGCQGESVIHSVMSDSLDCSLLGSSVHEILPARTLRWVVIPFSRGSNLGLQHCRHFRYHLSYQGSPGNVTKKGGEKRTVGFLLALPAASHPPSGSGVRVLHPCLASG